MPLEGLCLQIQLQRTGGYRGFLGKALEPPKEDSISSAIQTLKQIGALNDKENLTSLGQHLAALPVDVRVGKMLLYGPCSVSVAVLTIAACWRRSPFVAPLEKREEADAAKRMFAEDQSDHLTTLNAFNAWTDARSLGKAAEMAFTRENFLSFRTLEGIADMRNQFAQLLQEAGFLGGGGGGGRRGGRGGGGVREGFQRPGFQRRGARQRRRAAASAAADYLRGSAVGSQGPPPDDPV